MRLPRSAAAQGFNHPPLPRPSPGLGTQAPYSAESVKAHLTGLHNSMGAVTALQHALYHAGQASSVMDSSSTAGQAGGDGDGFAAALKAVHGEAGAAGSCRRGVGQAGPWQAPWG